MSAEISYFRTVSTNGQISRSPLKQAGSGGISAGAQSLAITASPLEMIAAPVGATIFCLQGTEALRYEYNTAAENSATATSHYLAVGMERWLDVESGKVISVRTA